MPPAPFEELIKTLILAHADTQQMQSNSESGSTCLASFVFPSHDSKSLVVQQLGLFTTILNRNSRLLRATCAQADQLTARLLNASTDVGGFTQDSDLGVFLLEAVEKVEIQMSKVCMATAEWQPRFEGITADLVAMTHEVWNATDAGDLEALIMDARVEAQDASNDLSGGLSVVMDAAMAANLDVREHLDKIHATILNIQADQSAPPFSVFLQRFARNTASGTTLVRIAPVAPTCPFQVV